MRPILEHNFLYESVSHVPHCGPVIAARLKKLQIETVEDLVHHLPARYEDHSQVSDVIALRDGEFATVRVLVQQLRGRRGFRRRSMHVVEALVTDETGSIRVVWFQQPYLTKTIAVGDEIFLSGKVSRDAFGLQFASPSYEKTSKTEMLHTARIIPIYGLTDGISQKQFRTLMKAALDKLESIQDWIPIAVRDEHKLLPFVTALHAIHFPEDLQHAAAARQRFQFDHALLHQLNQRVVQRYNASVHGCPLPLDVEVVKNFISTLPFTLTTDQKKAAYVILRDMEQNHPMNRLLQGDVGSGKTVVAAIAMRHAAAHGCTSILLAPTQILAEQHAATLQKILCGDEVMPIVLMTAQTKKKAKLPKEPCIVVGTHALLHDKTKYPQLGLVVVDEQHRFGVAQRKAIKEKNKAGYTPHFLSMSATPIPRSLSLVLYGSLAVSIIQQMPAGRRPIKTRVVEEKYRTRAEEFARERIAAGEQIFVVAPLIDPSDALGIESATEIFERLSTKAFAQNRVGLIHGRLKPKERVEIMEQMRAGDIDVLVATAVIEVGVDIPRATVMWIEGAERFGLAQLHQFRGRVGRGSQQSYCFLFSKSRGGLAEQRLALMEKTSDGFLLAEKDLEMRGAGEPWGIIQSGFSDVEFLRSIELDTWERAKRAAEQLMSIEAIFKQYPLLQKQIEHFEKELHYE